jgi:hypothetical protein
MSGAANPLLWRIKTTLEPQNLPKLLRGWAGTAGIGYVKEEYMHKCMKYIYN